MIITRLQGNLKKNEIQNNVVLLHRTREKNFVGIIPDCTTASIPEQVRGK